jgi:hypothetical protein
MFSMSLAQRQAPSQPAQPQSQQYRSAAIRTGTGRDYVPDPSIEQAFEDGPSPGGLPRASRATLATLSSPAAGPTAGPAVRQPVRMVGPTTAHADWVSAPGSRPSGGPADRAREMDVRQLPPGGRVRADPGGMTREQFALENQQRYAGQQAQQQHAAQLRRERQMPSPFLDLHNLPASRLPQGYSNRAQPFSAFVARNPRTPGPAAIIDDEEAAQPTFQDMCVRGAPVTAPYSPAFDNGGAYSDVARRVQAPTEDDDDEDGVDDRGFSDLAAGRGGSLTTRRVPTVSSREFERAIAAQHARKYDFAPDPSLYPSGPARRT